jgi:hypothetical protein
LPNRSFSSFSGTSGRASRDYSPETPQV